MLVGKPPIGGIGSSDGGGSVVVVSAACDRFQRRGVLATRTCWHRRRRWPAGGWGRVGEPAEGRELLGVSHPQAG